MDIRREYIFAGSTTSIAELITSEEQVDLFPLFGLCFEVETGTENLALIHLSIHPTVCRINLFFSSSRVENHDAKKGVLMRGKKIVAIFVFLFLCSPALRSSHQESANPSRYSATAGDIVKRFIQAVGGSELVNVGTEKRTGTLIRGVSGAVPFEMISEASGKWYYHQVFAYGDGVSYGFDGGQAWIQDTEGTSGLPPQERLELALLLDIQAPLKLEELFPRMTLKGPEKIGQKEAVVLSVESREGFGSELAFDRVTGLLLRAGDLFFEDYRDVGKVKRPFLVHFGKDSGPNPLRLKMQVSEIRQDIDVDGSIFMRPVCSLRPVPPLFYKLRKEVQVGQESMEACVGVYQSNSDPNILFTVTTQGPHLMIERTGWGMRVEIRPESETDYFMRFLHRDFHFVKDAAGRVTGLEMGTDRAQKAKKIK